MSIVLELCRTITPLVSPNFYKKFGLYDWYHIS